MVLRSTRGITLTCVLLSALAHTHVGDSISQSDHEGVLEVEDEGVPISQLTCLPDQECTRGLSVYFEVPGKEESEFEPACNQLLDEHYVKAPPALQLKLEEYDLQNTLGQDGFLVMMLDPDAPSPESCSETYWIHWMVQADLEFERLLINKIIVEYSPPMPPPGSGKHRYQLLVFQLKDDISVATFPLARSRFDITQFRKDVQLGEQVASFQFLVAV